MKLLMMATILPTDSISFVELIEQIKNVEALGDLNGLFLFIASTALFFATGFLSKVFKYFGLNVPTKKIVDWVHLIVFAFISVFGMIKFGLNLQTAIAIISIFTANKIYDVIKSLFDVTIPFLQWIKKLSKKPKKI